MHSETVLQRPEAARCRGDCVGRQLQDDCRAVCDRAVSGGEMVEAAARDGQRRAGQVRRVSHLHARAASRLRAGAARGGAASDAAQAQGPAGRARHRRVARHGVAPPAAHRPILQKKPHSPVGSIGPMSPGDAGAGSGRCIILIRSASSSSMRPGSRPTWPRSAAGASKASG